MEKPEILAPAGSMEALKAAISAGADAVYMGGNAFGARAYAENPDTEALLYAIEYVHLRGKRLYLTVNTLVKEREFGALYQFLAPYYTAGLDAAIVQDVGVLRFLAKEFPDTEIFMENMFFLFLYLYIILSRFVFLYQSNYSPLFSLLQFYQNFLCST